MKNNVYRTTVNPLLKKNLSESLNELSNSHVVIFYPPYMRKGCFVRPDLFSAERMVSGPFCFFCMPGFIFGGTEDVESGFHVLCSQTRFRRYRGRQVPFYYFALPDSFSAVQRASGSVFMFCAP
jgi:hypothetical protein